MKGSHKGISRLLASTLATATIVALAACGNSGASGGVTDTKADKGLPTMGTEGGVTYNPNHLVNDGKPIEIQYWQWGDDTATKAEGKKYEKIHPNVKVKFVQVEWNDYWTKLPLQLQGSQGPAVFAIHNSYDSIVKNYAAPLNIPLNKLEKDYINVDAHVRDGKVQYIDSVINTGNIYYNKDIWKEAGLTENDIPKTWDQLREVAKKLVKFDGSKMVRAGFVFNDHYDGLWQGLNYQKGVLSFKDGGKVVNFDNATTKENLKFLKDLYDVDKVGSANFGNDSARSFGLGQTAMVYEWGWMSGDLKTKYPKINWGVFPTPTWTEDEPFAYDRYNGESTPGINKNQSKEQQAVAQDFLNFMLADDDYIRGEAQQNNSYPAKRSLSDDAELKKMPVYAAIKPRVERLIWPGPQPAVVEKTSQQAFQNIFLNGQSIDKAVADAQKSMEEEMNSASDKFVSLESKYAHFDELKK